MKIPLKVIANVCRMQNPIVQNINLYLFLFFVELINLFNFKISLRQTSAFVLILQRFCFTVPHARLVWVDSYKHCRKKFQNCLSWLSHFASIPDSGNSKNWQFLLQTPGIAPLHVTILPRLQKNHHEMAPFKICPRRIATCPFTYKL